MKYLGICISIVLPIACVAIIVYLKVSDRDVPNWVYGCAYIFGITFFAACAEELFNFVKKIFSKK